jgi:bifunctional DNase/RNase
VIKVRIGGLSLDPVSEQPVLLLVPEDSSEGPDEPHIALPIWIGAAEAGAILLAVQGIVAPRPMTHDLLANTIGDLGYRVDRIDRCQAFRLGGACGACALPDPRCRRGLLRGCRGDH